MDVFNEWGELTKVFFSTKIALEREANLWRSVGIASPDDVELEAVRGQREYTVGLVHHIRVISDEHPLCALVLNLSYGVTEACARERLGVADLSSGVEAWGQQLLDVAGRDWGDVFGGKSGLIEVAVARNALAHGLTINETVENRFKNASGTCPWSLGDVVRLNFETTNVYRDRLRSLIRVSQPK